MWKKVGLLWGVLRGDARLLWFALKHPLSPGWLKPALVGVALYVISPIDLIPDVVPFFGIVDDVMLLPLAISFIARRLPPAVRDDYARQGR